MEDASWITLILIGVTAIALNVLILRAALSINQFLKYQKTQIKLLALVAERLEASPKLVQEIVFEADKEFQKDEHFAE